MNEKIWSFENVILFFCFAYFKKRRTTFFKNFFFANICKTIYCIFFRKNYLYFCRRVVTHSSVIKDQCLMKYWSEKFLYSSMPNFLNTKKHFFFVQFHLCYLLYFPTNEWMRMNTNILHSFFCLLLQKFGKCSVFFGTFYQA